MTEYLNELISKLKKKTEHLPPQVQVNALEVFMMSYQLHKDIHGSFRFVNGDQYYKKMNERYDFMLDKAIKYVTDAVSALG